MCRRISFSAGMAMEPILFFGLRYNFDFLLERLTLVNLFSELNK